MTRLWTSLVLALALAACGGGEDRSAGLRAAYESASFTGGKTTFTVEGKYCTVLATAAGSPTAEGVAAVGKVWPDPEQVFASVDCDYLVVVIRGEADGMAQEVTGIVGRCEQQACEVKKPGPDIKAPNIGGGP